MRIQTWVVDDDDDGFFPALQMLQPGCAALRFQPSSLITLEFKYGKNQNIDISVFLQGGLQYTAKCGM